MHHIPLQKPEGLCVDSPVLTTRPHDGAVTEQTMMSPEATGLLLQLLRPQFVFTGHDHEGCEYVHHDANTNSTSTEYTIRSMMGEYGGVTALFEIIPTDTGDYRFEFHYCPFVPLRLISVVIVTNIVWPIVFLVSSWIERKWF